KTCANPHTDKLSLAVIKNTLELGVMYISEGLLEAAKSVERLEILGEPQAMAFDDEGNLALDF
ncbi:MAG: hypothetical protein SCK28_10315, partial [Bacillota bacterium]|nr:hypothetical protein [Bacillota bacterium]